ncbi:MAG: NTP transferase domain-containing protein [Bacteroidales bacterium]|nr:NTP transferase domain-containing protein [Bacteroidales bacterium]
MDKYIIPATETIHNALSRLNDLSGGVMTLLVTNPITGEMVGTLTDGDIRRGILAGARLDNPVADIMKTTFKALIEGEDPITRLSVLRSAREKGIKLLPELSADGHITGVCDLTACYSRLPLSAILMAGGKGERLRPLTLTTPKPLLEIDGRPIIDYNIERLARSGITDVTVTVRYLADQICEYFSIPRHGIKVKCIEETIPLGTIGSAALIDRTDDGATLVMNSDLLTTVDLEEMYLRHVTENADITIAAIPYTVSVPYAILTTDANKVTSLQEKPTYSHFANAGIYIFNNYVLNALNPEERTDATTLIEAALEQGLNVSFYPINGTWIDIGSPADFRHALELMKHHRDLTN